MNVAITLCTTAAGAALMHITTTLTKKPNSPKDEPKTLKEQAAMLRQDFKALEAQHIWFVKNILPSLPSLGNEGDDDPHGLNKTELLLRGHGLDLIDVEDKISCGGVYLVNLQNEIDALAGDLKKLHFESMGRTKFAKKILKMHNDQKAQHDLSGKDNEKGEPETNTTITSEDSPLPSNVDMDPAEIEISFADKRTDLDAGFPDI